MTPREFADSRGIDWFDVEQTQRLVNALIAADAVTNRSKINAVMASFDINPGRPNQPNYVKVLVNAEQLGIEGIEEIAPIRRDLRKCLCGEPMEGISTSESTSHVAAA